MTEDSVLALETRRRIMEVIHHYPGLHLREIARQLDTSVALVEYHLPLLETAGLVRIMDEERYRRVFPFAPPGEGPSAADRRWLGLLREQHALGIVLHLLESGPCRHKDLVAALGTGKSKLSFHLAKLRSAGLVVKTDDGAFALSDRDRVARLLLDHRPTRDLRDAFADLWLSFYGR